MDISSLLGSVNASWVEYHKNDAVFLPGHHIGCTRCQPVLPLVMLTLITWSCRGMSGLFILNLLFFSLKLINTFWKGFPEFCQHPLTTPAWINHLYDSCQMVLLILILYTFFSRLSAIRKIFFFSVPFFNPSYLPFFCRRFLSDS